MQGQVLRESALLPPSENLAQVVRRRPQEYQADQGARFEVHFGKNRGFRTAANRSPPQFGTEAAGDFAPLHLLAAVGVLRAALTLL